MRLLKRIDHLMVESDDPSQAMRLFHETLGLPAAWPLQDHGFYRSGGIAFGNVNIEYIRFEGSEKGKNRLAGIAFEANEKFDAAAEELKSKGIAHRVGERTKDYASLILELEGYPVFLFICEYADGLNEWRNRVDSDFFQSRGGLIRATGVADVSIIEQKPERNLPIWKEIAPGLDTHVVHFESGPSLRLSQDRPSIEISVASREEAMDSLRSLGGIEAGRDFTFYVQEVEYRLVEK
jgi:hypothetical protein